MREQKRNVKASFRKRSTREIRQFADEAFGKVCPILYEWMTALCDDEGEVRDVVTVTFAVKDGRLKAMLSDPNTDEVCFVRLKAFDGSWSVIEEAITQGELEWIEKRKQHRQSSDTTRNGQDGQSPSQYSENNQNRR